MRIAQVALLYEAVPRIDMAGPNESWPACATGSLSAATTSRCSPPANRSRKPSHEVVPTPLRTRMTRQELLDVAPHIHLRMGELYRDGDFDVNHSHLDIWTMPFAATSAIPTVTTMHGRLTCRCCAPCWHVSAAPTGVDQC